MTGDALSMRRADPRPIRRLILFVAGRGPNSIAAQENLRRICDGETDCVWELRVVDVLDDYQAALDHGVLVTPCLVLLDRDPLVDDRRHAQGRCSGTGGDARMLQDQRRWMTRPS
jgi:hypothetical protein